MGSITATRLFLIAGVIVPAILTGCLGDRPATATSEDELKVKAASDDPRIAFMVERMGIREDAISRVIDVESNDTTYQVFPVVSEEAKARGVLVGGFGFTTMSLDKMIRKIEKASEKAEKDAEKSGSKIEKASEKAEKDAEKSGSIGEKTLAKSAHTRWDYWYSGFDVKYLHEVNQVKVYIGVTGPSKLGPNWQAAIRNGIANWNAQAIGTAVSFVETTDSNASDVMIRGSFGIGSDGTATHMAFMSPEPIIERHIVTLWVNSGHEHHGIPHNQKTTVAMSVLTLATNITFVGIEGMYWNMGNVIHIPGTPYTDGDPETPGSSVLTYGTSPNSTPVLTQGDLRALRTVYPLHGASAITEHAYQQGSWRTVGYQSYPIATTSITAAQVASDTVFLRLSQVLARKIGLNGSLQFLYTSAGNNLMDKFYYSKGNLVVRTVGGSLFTQMPGGGWILQATGVGSDDFRLDGNRLTYSVVNPNNPYLPGGKTIYTKYITPTGGGAPILTYHEVSYLADFRTLNGLLVVSDGGNVSAMQDFSGWHNLHQSSNGYADRLYVTENLIAMFYYKPSDWSTSVAVRAGGLYGNWLYYSDPVYSPDDIDVCGNNVAYLQQTAWLRVIDFSTWIVHEHYLLPNPPFAKVRITGVNCDYLQTVDHSGFLRSKYGVDLNTDYSPNYGGVTAFAQK